MKKQNVTVKNTLRWLLVAVAIVCGGIYVYQQASMAAGKEIYAEAAELAFTVEEVQPAPTPSPTPAPEGQWVPAPVEEEDEYITQLESIDLDALREVNPDVIGWILIPGGEVNYPIMKGEDNEEYLRRAWTGKRNYVGSIFMETMNTSDFTDFHTILYGHNMSNGDMFGQLRLFNESRYRKANPYIYIATDAGVYRYEVYSMRYAAVDSDTYRLSFNEATTRAEFLVNSVKKDTGNYGIFPQPTDRILTLSTCTGDGYSKRYVVQARLSMIQVEAEEAEETIY